MEYRYTMQGTCAKEVHFTVEEGKITSCEFIAGCPGNLLGISQIVIGMPVEQVIERFEHVTCGRKNTSCPDQFAKALIEVR